MVEVFSNLNRCLEFVLICTRKHTMIPYKAASKFLDQRKGREGNEEREGEGGGGLFVEEMERGVGCS